MNSRNEKIAIFILIWALASGLGIYLRLYTLRNNVSHENTEKATLTVINSIKNSTYKQVEKSNPALSPSEKQLLAKKQFDATLHAQAAKVRETIDRVARQIQDNDPSGKTPFYLPEADSYYYYNLTENIVTAGTISPQIKASKYFNPLMNAPHGYWEPLNLHPYVGFAVYKIANFLSPGISLMQAVSFTPLVMTIIILFVFLVACAILECSAWVSLLSAFYLVCIPVFLRRSMFGWYKNDPANIFFLFIIPTALFYGLKNINDRKKALVAAAATSFLLALYSLFWQGWVFLASLIGACGFFALLYNILLVGKKEQTKDILFFFSVVIIGAFVGVSLIFGPRDFFILFEEGWRALQDFINPQLSLWPDLYIAVGELLRPTTEQWFEMMGGPFFIGIGVFGLLMRTVRMFRKRDDPLNTSTIFLLLFWLAGAKLSFGAQRFATLCLIPFALAFAIGAQYIFAFIKKHLFKTFPFISNSPFTQGLILAGVILILTFPPLNAAQKKTPEILNRIFNSTWDLALTKIKNATPKESIINSWWPPGHFIKAIAQRRVTFDGATINKPQSYWLANVFLATDEHSAAGILRMLNNSGNDATDYLLAQGFSLDKAVKLLKKITAVDKETAKSILSKTLREDQTQKLLTLTHAKAPASYLLLYNDMAENSLQFSFVGNWDFEKVAQINADKSLRESVPSKNSNEYVPFLWKLAGGATKYSPELALVSQKQNVLTFEHNIRVDFNTLSCWINSPKFGTGIPASLIYEKDGQFIEQKLPSATLPYSVMIIKNGPITKCRLAQTTLAKSILFRLYDYGGSGLKIFEPFIDERDTTERTKILVYKINWDKF